jgi:hypothetical protein
MCRYGEATGPSIQPLNIGGIYLSRASRTKTSRFLPTTRPIKMRPARVEDLGRVTS